MQCRKGPGTKCGAELSLAGHTATFASLDLRKAGAKTQDLGPRRSSDQQVHGTYAKNSK
jgi:hypothetical protein